MGVTADDYLLQLQALLPPGPAWPKDDEAPLTRLLAGLSEELSRVHGRVDQLVDEASPTSAMELVPDWERVVGLPDACSAELATTIAERRMNVAARLIQQGGSSRDYFVALAAQLGYTVEIDEYRPFVTGFSRCGETLDGAPIIRHTWRVRVLNPRYTPFRTGASQCGDLLGKIIRAEDLECLLKRKKQAHTEVIVAYQGA